VQNPHVDAIPLPKLFRGADYEFFFLVDDPADEIGDPSGGKGGMWTPFENDDVQFGTASPCLGGGAHSRGISTDDDQFGIGHAYSPVIISGQPVETLFAHSPFNISANGAEADRAVFGPVVPMVGPSLRHISSLPHNKSFAILPKLIYQYKNER
jgi:hypothetical protein